MTSPAEIVSTLRRTSQTIALAESCTAGAVAARIASVPGASSVLWGGWVVYSRGAKVELIGSHARRDLRRAGTVSRWTTIRLARAARRRSGATWGVAVTCHAGPGTDGPGTVGHGYVVAVGRRRVEVVCPVISGDRAAVQDGFVEAALTLVGRIIA